MTYQREGATSDPVFVPKNLYPGNLFSETSLILTRADLLTKPRAPQAPKAVEQKFLMLWYQKSFQAFKIEQELEVFRKKQKEAREEVLEKFSTLKKNQKQARDKWRNEISEIGPQSVFMKVIG